MELSKRIQSINPPLIKEIADKAATIPGCVRFDIGEPDFDTPEHIKRAAIKAIEEGFTHYTSSYGIPELREAVARWEAKRKTLDLTAENVIITAGGMGAIFTILCTVIDPGDAVIIQDPCWSPYGDMVLTAGGRPVQVPFTEEGEVDEDLLRKTVAENERVRAVIINSPSNPVGDILSRKALGIIADVAHEHGLFVISDEIYDRLVYEGEHISMVEFDRDFERTFLVNSFSKTYAMTGWRVGYIVTRPDYMKHLVKANRSTVACPPSIAQKAALAAITGPQDCVDEMVREYRRRRDYMLKKLEEWGLPHPRPKGAFYVFPDISAIEPDSFKFAMDLLEKAKVSVIPGHIFGSKGRGHLRICYANSYENVVEGFERMEKYLKELGAL